MFGKNSLLLVPVMVVCATLLSGCELIGDIFQAGMWVGIIIILLIVAAVMFLFKKFRS